MQNFSGGFVVGGLVMMITLSLFQIWSKPRFIHVPEDISGAKIGEPLVKWQKDDTLFISFYRGKTDDEFDKLILIGD